MELVYSVDGSQYLSWQADLLDWTARRVNANYRITRLTQRAPEHQVYSCLNRFWSLANAWQPSEHPTVAVLDPDMVLVRALEVAAPAGILIGQPYSYLFDLPWCPLILHRDRVREWATKALELARTIHGAGGGWVSEMWAGSIAANQIGLRLERRPLCVFNSDPELGDAAVIHYCYDHGGFSKQRYVPGHVIPWTSQTPVSTTALLTLNNAV